jgi:hypothetical protein
MSITPRSRKSFQPTTLEGFKPFVPLNPIATPITEHQQAISRDLVIALEATERLNNSLDQLIKVNGCSEFLASHRLLGERITSNRNMLLMLIGNAMDISIKAGKPELQATYPDYFTK